MNFLLRMRGNRDCCLSVPTHSQQEICQWEHGISLCPFTWRRINKDCWTALLLTVESLQFSGSGSSSALRLWAKMIAKFCGCPLMQGGRSWSGVYLCRPWQCPLANFLLRMRETASRFPRILNRKFATGTASRDNIPDLDLGKSLNCIHPQGSQQSGNLKCQGNSIKIGKCQGNLTPRV